MPSDSTSWTIIERAANGSAADREAFAHRYGPVIRAYLGARWRGSALTKEVDDATQEVFIDCFKDHGALGRADQARGDFRAFLYGIVRNVARGVERKLARRKERQPTSDLDLDGFARDDAPLSRIFDRAWASAILQEAADLQLERARMKGADAIRRHRLLTVRYGEGLPMREIAKRWAVDVHLLYREHPKAREEFRSALEDVVRGHGDGGPEAIHRECARLLALFS